MNVITSADGIARCTYNALKYCPKASPWDVAYLVVEPGCVSIVTSDSYALCWSSCAADTRQMQTDELAVKILREDLIALEKRAREGKGERCTLEFFVEDFQLWYRGEDPEKDLQMTDIFLDGVTEDSWDEINLSAFRDLISEREEDPEAQLVMLAAPYLQKLGQLKKEKDQGVHLWISGENDTVLAKIGEHERILIQPIDAERHRAALGEEATW